MTLLLTSALYNIFLQYNILKIASFLIELGHKPVHEVVGKVRSNRTWPKISNVKHDTSWNYTFFPAYKSTYVDVFTP